MTWGGYHTVIRQRGRTKPAARTHSVRCGNCVALLCAHHWLNSYEVVLNSLWSTKWLRLVLCITFMFGIGACADRESSAASSDVITKPPPQVRIVGDDKDVGSVVFLDGQPVATLEATFLGIPQTTIHLAPGRHVVEVRNGGVLRALRDLEISSDSGVIGMPARDGL